MNRKASEKHKPRKTQETLRKAQLGVCVEDSVHLMAGHHQKN